MVVGLGNTGTNVVKMAALSSRLNNVEYYAIDSVMVNMDLDSINDVTFIPIISDEKSIL